MKQILSSVGILLLLILLSVSDFHFDSPDRSDKIADWDASQYDCLEFKLPDRVLDGSDSSCYAAAMIMQQALDRYNVNCLYISNPGWIPTSKNPVNRQWIKFLLTDQAPY